MFKSLGVLRAHSRVDQLVAALGSQDKQVIADHYECKAGSRVGGSNSLGLYWNYTTGQKTVFTRSAITPPKVDGLG